MPLELMLALLAAAVTALGWLVNHVLAERAARHRQHLEAQLEHTTRQIESLYGPLAFLIIEGKQVFADLLESLGRNYVFVEGEDLPEDELETWLFWLDNSFLPANREIRDLLRDNAHLIEGSEMPESYATFLQHYSSWEIHHLRWQKQQHAYNWHSSINWPTAFADDVLATFSLLKQRHARLVGQL